MASNYPNDLAEAISAAYNSMRQNYSITNKQRRARLECMMSDGCAGCPYIHAGTDGKTLCTDEYEKICPAQRALANSLKRHNNGIWRADK